MIKFWWQILFLYIYDLYGQKKKPIDHQQMNSYYYYFFTHSGFTEMDNHRKKKGLTKKAHFCVKNFKPERKEWWKFFCHPKRRTEEDWKSEIQEPKSKIIMMIVAEQQQQPNDTKVENVLNGHHHNGEVIEEAPKNEVAVNDANAQVGESQADVPGEIVSL